MPDNTHVEPNAGASPEPSTPESTGQRAGGGRLAGEPMAGEPTKPPSNAPVPTTDLHRASPFLFRFRDQVLLAAVSALALVAMLAYWARTSHWGAEPIELERQPERELEYQIDLNSATWVEWSQLPGIGPQLAHRIVQDREDRGPFRTLDELKRVKGIGPKKIEAVRPFVRQGPAGENKAGELGS